MKAKAKSVWHGIEESNGEEENGRRNGGESGRKQAKEMKSESVSIGVAAKAMA